MEFIKTLTDSFQAIASNFKNRITNPIGGAFLTSWLIINWQLVYYFLLNDDKVVNKIEFIEKNYSDLTYTIYWPAGLAAIYILIYPTLSNLSSFIWAITDKWSKQLSAKYIENKIPLNEDDKRNILKSMREQAIRIENEKAELLSQIDSLNAALTNFEPVQHKNNDNDKVQKLKVGGNGALLQDKNTSTEKVSLSDSVVLSKLNTEKGRYLLSTKLAKLFHLDVDFPHDKQEITFLCEIFKNVLKASPAGFEPRNIKINTTQIDINQVNKFLARLQRAGLLTKDNIDEKAFTLNEQGRDFSLNIANEA